MSDLCWLLLPVQCVNEFFDIPDEYRIVLYAPTFRRDDEDYLSRIDFSSLRDALHERFGYHFVVLTHLHVNVKPTGVNLKYDANKVIDGNSYPDMQELLVASDILISDYSSVAFDFALMNKPVFRFLPDLKAYREDRDMYLDIDEYPYPRAESNDEMKKEILQFDCESYLAKLEQYMNRIGAFYNGNSSKRVVEYISTFVENGLDKKNIYEKYYDDFDIVNDVSLF